jgi:signal transduction histidine kinase
VSAARLLLPPAAPADPILVEVRGDLQGAIADIRRLVYGLRPPTLDEFGLIGAIRERAADYSVHGRTAETPGLRIDVEAPERLPTLPAAVEVAAYRIVEEALTNVVRHANAQRCIVRLALGDALELEVGDDGVGVPQACRAGVGFTSMRERAEELGGSCVVEPATGGGTRVVARLPVARE